MQVVSSVAGLAGQGAVDVQRLSGGLTNTNFKVLVNGTPFFVRVPGESTELLAVDRKNEYFNAKAAAEAGVGPKVLYYLPEFQVMVLEFLDGRTMSNAGAQRAWHASRNRAGHQAPARRPTLSDRLQHVSSD